MQSVATRKGKLWYASVKESYTSNAKTLWEDQYPALTERNNTRNNTKTGYFDISALNRANQARGILRHSPGSRDLTINRGDRYRDVGLATPFVLPLSERVRRTQKVVPRPDNCKTFTLKGGPYDNYSGYAWIGPDTRLKKRLVSVYIPGAEEFNQDFQMEVESRRHNGRDLRSWDWTVLHEFFVNNTKGFKFIFQDSNLILPWDWIVNASSADPYLDKEEGERPRLESIEGGVWGIFVDETLMKQFDSKGEAMRQLLSGSWRK